MGGDRGGHKSAPWPCVPQWRTRAATMDCRLETGSTGNNKRFHHIPSAVLVTSQRIKARRLGIV